MRPTLLSTLLGIHVQGGSKLLVVGISVPLPNASYDSLDLVLVKAGDGLLSLS